jgi:cobalamin synthase
MSAPMRVILPPPSAGFPQPARWWGAVALATGLARGWIPGWGAGRVVVWVGITGALHLDGLGDMADAGAAHKDPARITAVLADLHIGSFGVVAIALQLIAKLVLIHALAPERLGWLVALAMVARITAGGHGSHPRCTRGWPAVFVRACGGGLSGLGALAACALPLRHG